MSAPRAERAYSLLLRAYPAEFRDAYAREMTLVFRDLAREREVGGVGFWWEILTDVARTAPALRVEALRARWNPSNRIEERRMKPIGVLAILIGVIQAANAVVELSADPAGRTGTESASVVLAIVVGALLAVAGVAMLRRSPRATMLARVAAMSWLGLALMVRIVYPWMSIATMTLAVVFPLVLLVYVQVRGSAGPVAR